MFPFHCPEDVMNPLLVKPNLAMFNFGPMEIFFVFLIVLLVFGAGKLPKIAKDVGSGIREFKKSVSGERDDEKDDKKDETKTS